MKVQRNPNSAYIRSVRPMVKSDLEALRQPSARVRLKRISDSHHIMARLFVSGLTLAEIAAETGYSITRVSYLRGAPAMRELIDRYRAEDHSEWRKHRDATYESILAAEAKSWRKINDILDADDDNEVPEIPLRDLMKIADSGSDRTGHHRKSTKENINIDFAAKLELAIARSRSVREIDITPESSE
jgi:DNA-binding CsgD family transcriptional regulator